MEWTPPAVRHHRANGERPLEGQGKEESRWSIRPSLSISQSPCFRLRCPTEPGRVDEERRLSRDRFLPFFAQQPPATVLLEACGSAHYWARQLQPFGHTVRLLPAARCTSVRAAQQDRPHRREGLLEADRNEEIHAGPVKTVEQQAIASLHRLRSTWLATRTARLNTVRGLLREFGIFIPVGAQHVVPQRAGAARGADRGPAASAPALAAACDEIAALETNMRAVERQLAALAPQMPDVTLLQTVPGVGLLTATALVALVGDIRRFPSGRHFASFLGLTPKEDSSASRRRLGAISKQGDVYVRMLLIHGARSVLWHAKRAATRRPAAWALHTRAAARAQHGHRRRRQQTRPDRLGRLEQQRPFAADAPPA